MSRKWQCRSVVGWVAALLAVGVFGCGQQGWYHDEVKSFPGGGPLAKAAAPETFMFVVMGDTRTGIEEFRRQIAEINLLSPDLVIDVGDLIDGYSQEADEVEEMWDEFDQIVSTFEVPLVMVPGNHDIWDKQSDATYRRRYGKTHFSFDYKGVHFVVLNTEVTAINPNGSAIDPAQLDWLEEDLAGADNARAIFVFQHKPLWQDVHTSAGSDTWWQAEVHPILARHGVDAVFAGHVHKYVQGPVQDGVHYYITGGGGVGIGHFEEFGDFYHYCIITVRGQDWQMAVVKPGGIFNENIVTQEMLLFEELLTHTGTIALRPNEYSAKAEVMLSNPFDREIEVILEPSADAEGLYEVEPSSRRVQLAVGEEVSLTFMVTVSPTQQVAKIPFTWTITGVTEEPMTISVSMPIKRARVAVSSSTAVAPTIDGKLDDAAWARATAQGEFVKVGQTDPAAYATEVWATHDEKNLYFAFRCEEPELAGLILKAKERDGVLWQDDSVEIFVDTNLDRKTYYHFIINAAGLQYDAITMVQPEWNGQWTRSAGRESGAWTLEVAIPWSTLGMDGTKLPEELGLQLARNRSQKPQEWSHWSATFGGNHFPAEFGIMQLEKW